MFGHTARWGFKQGGKKLSLLTALFVFISYLLSPHRPLREHR